MPTVTEKVIKQLNKTNLSIEDRIALTNTLLNKLNTLPIGDMVIISENRISINGKDLDQEQAIAFREATVALKENFARKVINEQIRYKAIELGLFTANSNDTLMFSKAAVWVLNEYEILLNKLTF